MKILMSGGGTGGHINPALAIAALIAERDSTAQFLFVGTPNGMENTLVPAAGYRMATMPVAGFQRRLSMENIRRNIQAFEYLRQAQPRSAKILDEFQPDLAIGTGGYVAGPILYAAAKRGIPVVVHEQNAYPGITNKLLARHAAAVMLTVEAAKKHFPAHTHTVLTGLPVRGGMAKPDRAAARAQLGFDDAPCILSFGGSLGAGCINDAMVEVIRRNFSSGARINHIHGYGGNGRDTVPQALDQAHIPMKSKRLRVTEYINDMDICLAAADLVICRSGASTLAELEAAGRGSILIPSPIVTANHQFHNANVLGAAGAAIVIEQKDAAPERVAQEVEKLCRAPERLRKMGENAKKLEITDTNERIWETLRQVMMAQAKKAQ